MDSPRPKLLAIVELGGYPNFSALYRDLGFEVTFVNSQRKAQSWLKQAIPAVVVGEYNFQSDFRDRTSNLETLMARLQRNPSAKVIVFYQTEHETKLATLQARFPVFGALPLPVDAAALRGLLREALASQAVG